MLIYMYVCINAKNTRQQKGTLLKKYNMRIVDMLWEFYLYQLLNRRHPIPPTHKEMKHLATQNIALRVTFSISRKFEPQKRSMPYIFSICDHNDKHF